MFCSIQSYRSRYSYIPNDLIQGNIKLSLSCIISKFYTTQFLTWEHGAGMEMQKHTPFPFKGGLWHVRHGDHLFSGSDPHDGAIVTFCRALQPQTGECSPRQSSLHKHRTGNFRLRNTHTHTYTGGGRADVDTLQSVLVRILCSNDRALTFRKGESSSMLRNSGK